MSRDEFEKSVNTVEKEAYWQGYDENGGSTMFDVFERTIIDAKAQLLSAYDEMAAEIERLRWRYPERGELPDEGELVVAYLLYHGETVICRYTDVNDGEQFGSRKMFEAYDGEPCYDPEHVTRWRYVE